MTLKQRELNKQAIEFAASLIRDADFDELFPDTEDAGDEDYLKMERAQINAVKRILSLIK